MSHEERKPTLRLTALAVVLLGMAVVAGACGSDNGNGSSQTPTAAPTAIPIPPQACSGQGLIGIDPINNVAYAPLLATDNSGNAQVEAVDLTPGAPNPLLKKLKLTGASSLIAVAYNPNNQTMLVEAVLSAGGIGVYVIDATTKSVTGHVKATGLNPGFGGILEDIVHNRAFVAGYSTIGILDTSKNPPVWNAGSVVSLSPANSFTDSLSLNIATGMLFISGDGGNAIINTNHLPLNPKSFDSSFGITDGNAFDPSTNILALSQEVGADQTWVFNFNSLDTTVSPATANYVKVPGMGDEQPPIGEGPGGELVINCATHRAVVADEGGQNLKLLHLPTKSVPASTPLNNNGQPGSHTTADAASAYTIAATIIPKAPGSVQLYIQRDPNSATIDPAHNYFYALATDGGENQYLVRVDLAHPTPPFGGSPTGTKQWTPAGATGVIALP
jgi:hypothetical protein